MDKVVALEPEARTVTVDAGMTYGQLCPLLHSKGFALHIWPRCPYFYSWSVQHRNTCSGEKNGNLATAVSALEIVTAAGEVVKTVPHRDGEAFLGAAVGLGALGVIAKVTLDIQPTYMVRQYVYENLPLGEVKDHFDAIESTPIASACLLTGGINFVSEVWIRAAMKKGKR